MQSFVSYKRSVHTIIWYPLLTVSYLYTDVISLIPCLFLIYLLICLRHSISAFRSYRFIHWLIATYFYTHVIPSYQLFHCYKVHLPYPYDTVLPTVFFCNVVLKKILTLSTHPAYIHIILELMRYTVFSSNTIYFVNLDNVITVLLTDGFFVT